MAIAHTRSSTWYAAGGRSARAVLTRSHYVLCGWSIATRRLDDPITTMGRAERACAVVGTCSLAQLDMMAHPTNLHGSGPEAFRAGLCAILGLPNVGKSTLLNMLVGERLSIVTPKAQTTRRRVLGIYSDGAHQAVFVDTPGLLEPRYLLHEAMQEEAARARAEADLVVYVVDVGWGPSIEHAMEFRAPEGVPGLLCLHKMDRPAGRGLADLRGALGEGTLWTSVHETSAITGQGVPELRHAILGLLPVGPALFPLDEIAAAPVRFFAAELIRETCFEELGEEVPYSVAVEIDEFREDQDPVFIGAIIHVERESQKGIVIGKGGRTIRQVGMRARKKIEAFLDRKVFLDLRVKVMPNWRRQRGRLKLLGYLPSAGKE